MRVAIRVSTLALMPAVSATGSAGFPSMGMTASDLLQQEALRDISAAQRAYTRAVTEVTASQ